MLKTSGLEASGQPFDIRAGDPARDVIDGVVPQVVVSPHTPAAVAATLGWASSDNLSVVIRGGGSKMAWGARPNPVDVVLDTSRLNRILAHRAGDLTVKVEAGMPLRALNLALAAHGQWLALDPPFEETATVGGLLATNDSGPHRHRFGTPRDLVIGIELATADGRLTKAGGQVVKNVAGYDLSKLMSGSFGALAAIVGATFKLSPRPAASSTIVVNGLESEEVARIAERVAASQLEPVAFDVRRAAPGPGGGSTLTVLLRFSSFPAVVEAETADAAARIAAVHPLFDVVAGDAERAIWREHGERLWSAPGAVVRASWLPGELRQVLAALEALSKQDPIEMIGRLGVGAGLLRIDGAPQRQVEVVEQLRGSRVFGNVTVARGPDALKTREGVWGPRRNGPLLDAIKQQLDPRGILGAGRGPL